MTDLDPSLLDAPGPCLPARVPWTTRRLPDSSSIRWRFPYRPMVRVGGVLMSAARAAYLSHHGAIPAGQVIHHVCQNGECVAPAHLVALPPSEHARIHALLRRRVAV